MVNLKIKNEIQEEFIMDNVIIVIVMLVVLVIVDLIIGGIAYKLLGLFVKSKLIQEPSAGIALFLLFVFTCIKNDSVNEDHLLKVAVVINTVAIAVVTGLLIYNSVSEHKKQKNTREKTITQDDLNR